ncbi:MAG: sulfite dehydrogenase [Azospirillum sp.]|nr:sulfite dehydrogenase [Azospirillum sp.]
MLGRVVRVTDAAAPAGPSRRQLIAGGGVLAAAAVALGAGPARPQDIGIADHTRHLGTSVDEYPYGVPSPHEAQVIRRSVPWLTATRESSINFTPLHELEGIVTPSGVCFERHHAGAPDIGPAEHRLMIHGLVERPLVLTMAELRRFPPVTRFYFLECAANSGMEWRGAQLNGVQFTHGMIHCVQYAGVPLRTLLEECGVKPAGKWLLAEGADAAAMTRSLPIEKALDDCLVAYTMNGERLRREQGYPLRLVVPGWEGNVWVKWLRRLEIGDQPWYQREETSKYTDLMPDGRARQFSWLMEPKSVIVNPSPQAPLTARGANVLRGFAWTGNGLVKRVDVSLDGGINWTPARLEGPLLPKCLTQFYHDFVWNGEPMLLQSRVIDETGYVQPTYQQLIDIRGVNSVYHNHAIQTWLVNEAGGAENVRVS